MTERMINRRSLVEKAPDALLLPDVIAFAAERLMEREVGTLTGVGAARRARPGWCGATARRGYFDPLGQRSGQDHRQERHL